MRDIRPVPKMPKREPFEPARGLEPSRRELFEISADHRQSKKPDEKKSRFTGSKVPVANIHVPKQQIPAARDTAPSTEKGRPLFAKRLFAKKAPGGRELRKTSSGGKPRMRIGHKERRVVGILILLLVVVVLLAGWLFLPKADIRLVLRTAPLLVDEQLVLRSQDTSPTNVIPGTAFFRELSVEGTSPVISSEVVGEKAKGTAQIVNRATEEQKIVERSRLVTKDGQLFYMTNHAIVPPASGGTPARATVQIEAAEAGEEGNIGPQRLDFAALDESSQTLVYAEVTQALTEGSGEEVRVVKEQDLKQAKSHAGEQARAQAEQEIRAELPEGWAILEESWTAELQSFETEASVDDREQAIPYKARIVVRVMGYEEQKLEERLRAALEERLEADFMLFPGPISFTKSVEEVNWEAAEASIGVRVTHTTIPQLSLETLQEKLAGRDKNEAVAYLEGLPGVRSGTVDLWPFWVQSVPRIEKRIMIDLEPEKQPI